MRTTLLNPPQGVSPIEIEFEIKLGLTSLSEKFDEFHRQKVNSNEYQNLINKMKNNNTWELLPEPKLAKNLPFAYTFEPCIKGYKKT